MTTGERDHPDPRVAGAVERNLRRLVRPSAYINLMYKGIDRVREAQIDHRIEQTAERIGKGFFVVQVGANDGIHSDPIRKHIARQGWSGLLVEPNPRMASDLRDLYAATDRIRVAQVAVSDTNGTSTFYATKPRNGKNPLQGKDSFHLDVLEKPAHVQWVDNYEAFIDEIEVETITPQALLERYDVDHVDMLTIDTEGHDAVVLGGFDLEGLRPAMVLYEHYHLDPQDAAEAEQRLEDLGYELMHTKLNTFGTLAA